MSVTTALRFFFSSFDSFSKNLDVCVYRSRDDTDDIGSPEEARLSYTAEISVPLLGL
jgi:hypothetical protein